MTICYYMVTRGHQEISHGQKKNIDNDIYHRVAGPPTQGAQPANKGAGIRVYPGGHRPCSRSLQGCVARATLSRCDPLVGPIRYLFSLI